MSETQIKNAIIKSTMLGYEDHGILTAFVTLDYGGSGQGFGGRAFDEPIKDPLTNDFISRRGVAYGMEWIARVLNTVGVESWEKLPGTPVRVKMDIGKVYAIGHYLEDKWFDPKELAIAMAETANDLPPIGEK